MATSRIIVHIWPDVTRLKKICVRIDSSGKGKLVSKAARRLYLSKAEGRHLTTPDDSEGSQAISDQTQT